MLSKALRILFVNRDISHKLKICFLIGCVPCHVHRSAILNSRISEAKSLIIYRELEVSALTRIHRAPTWCKPGLASEVPQKLHREIDGIFVRIEPMESTLQFFGGAGRVTGANFLLQSNPDHSGGTDARLLVDCGLFQGCHSCEGDNWEPFPFDPASVQIRSNSRP